MNCDFHKNIKWYNLFLILLIKRNVSWASSQHIRMISEGLCDIDDWSNGCWKFSFAITGINSILKYIKNLKYFFKL